MCSDMRRRVRSIGFRCRESEATAAVERRISKTLKTETRGNYSSTRIAIWPRPAFNGLSAVRICDESLVAPKLRGGPSRDGRYLFTIFWYRSGERIRLGSPFLYPLGHPHSIFGEQVGFGSLHKADGGKSEGQPGCGCNRHELGEGKSDRHNRGAPRVRVGRRRGV